MWSGQLLVLRPEAVVYQLWHPVSHTEVWEAASTQRLNSCCTSGRNTNNWPDHTFLYRYRVRHFDLGQYRVMPKHPATVGTP